MPLKTVTLCRLLCVIFVLGFAAPCLAQQTMNNANILFTADVLKIMLYAKTPGERWFCEYIIQKRDDGTIPPQIIYAVYRKAIFQEKYRRFAYFKYVLEILCMREGIALYPNPSVNVPPGMSHSMFPFPSRQF